MAWQWRHDHSKSFFFLLKAARGVDFFDDALKIKDVGGTNCAIISYLLYAVLVGGLTDISYCDPLCQTLKLRYLSNRQ